MVEYFIALLRVIYNLLIRAIRDANASIATRPQKRGDIIESGAAAARCASVIYLTMRRALFRIDIYKRLNRI